MKYVTAVVVLQTFDPNSSFITELVSSETATRIPKAYIRTNGDPTFVSQVGPVPRRPEFLTPKSQRTFQEFVDNIYDSGVRAIGSLEIENAWFKIPAVESGWSSDRSLVGQLSALSVDEGFQNNELAQNPDVYSAELLKSLLQDKGIEVGEITFGSIPDDMTNVVATTKSAPIIDIVADMLSTSNNVYAEQLLAAATKQDKGVVTLENRSQQVTDVLSEILDGQITGLTFANGSGYSRNAKVSCKFMNDLVRYFYSKSEINLVELSSVAGERGTLTERFINIEDSIEAKTGTLNGVTALSGKIDGDLLFSFIANGSFSQQEGFALQEEALLPLAGFPKIVNFQL